MKDYIGLEISVGGKELINYLNNVPEKTQIEVEKRIPNVRRNTKKVVQKFAPSNRGIYKKSFTINNYARQKWEIGYEVYAKPPHYRLSHLLEGRDDDHPSYAHILKQFRWGQGEPTKNGKVGMVVVGTTKRFLHLIKGKEFAEEKVEELYNIAIKESTKELR